MQNTIREVMKHKVMYLFLLPALITVIIFSYRPMFGIIMAFQDYSAKLGFYGSPFVGLKQFREFLATPDFYQAFKNTVGINVLMIVLGFPIPIIFALIINEIKFSAFKRVTQTITYLPHFISWVVVGGMIYRLLDYDSGSINVLISFFGGDRIAFMRDARYFWSVLITSSIWKDLGWNTIIYLAAMSSIDPELYSAAFVDGAGRFKKLLYITIPGIAPTAGLMLIFAIGTLVNASGGASFDAIFNLKNSLVMEAANVLDLYTYTQGVQWLRISYATAIGLTQSIVSLCLVLGANRLSKKMLGYGAF